MQRLMYVPPGGFVGAQSQSQAAQAVLFGRGSRSSSPRRRKRRASVKRTSTRRKKRASSSRASTRRGSRKARRFVKGSAAARRHMAKLRAMRKRR